MSLRPHTNVVASCAAKTNRLARVLTTGLTVRPAVEFSTEPKRRAVGKDGRSSAATDPFLNLSHDELVSIAEKISAEKTCQDVAHLCSTDKWFVEFCRNDDGFWKMVCEIKEYDRKDRITGFHAMTQTIDSGDPDKPIDKLPWRTQFIKWCKLRLTDKSFRYEVKALLNYDPTGKGTVPGSRYGPIGSWDVSDVTDMSWMFHNATSFNGDVSKWTFPNVTSMSYMFGGAKSFNGDVSEWTFPNVVNMRGMFSVATSFNGDVSKWTFPEVTNMVHMFWGATSFEGNGVSKWTFPNVTRMDSMFWKATSFRGRFSAEAIEELLNRGVEVPDEASGGLVQ